ncbi:IS630 family transposase [Deinococcus multiflagellatus]|uniref:IS630 family transposase n=1 Tax=Deinococcus multiflagellatus TaxID=1656887 RepID=A0ABW1ZT63_9DEIO
MKSWCLPRPGAMFVAKMEDVLDVYARPYDSKRPVVCVDETTKELHSTPRGSLPVQAERPEREDYVYARHGTVNVFLSMEPLAGKRRVRLTERHTKLDFAEELRCILEEDYPDAEKVVLVTDNLNTHGLHALYEAFEPAHAGRLARRLEWHFTPEHASWLNMAEIELSALSVQAIGGRIGNREELARRVEGWEHERNQRQVHIDWQFRTEDARIKLKRLYPRYKPVKLS